MDGSDNQAIIGRYEDTFIKNTRSGRVKTVYQESPAKAYYISDFEARQLYLVSKTFVSTLEDFESDLSKEHWGRCLYLDAFMPRFLRRFYLLYCVTRNSIDSLPYLIKIPASEYDVSLNSPKSDARIAKWRATPNHVMKLRIATQELVYQTKLWQKKDLTNSKRDPQISGGARFEEAYALFVRIYFNLQPPPEIKYKGRQF
jgi:hypothetical protein